MTHNVLAEDGPQLFIYKSVKGTDICQLYKPIEFECVAEGKTLNVSLTHAEDDGTQWLYHMQFSDGYKAAFMLNRQNGRFVEQGTNDSTLHSNAVNDDLFSIYQFNPYNPPFCLCVTVKGEPVNVWVKKEVSGYWYVHHGGKLRFFLHCFTGEWQAETIDRPGSYVLPEILQAVIKRLKSNIEIARISSASL